jgi:hypothetical protein
LFIQLTTGAESDSIMKFLSKNSFFEEDNFRALIIVSNSTSFDSLIPTETEKKSHHYAIMIM